MTLLTFIILYLERHSFDCLDESIPYERELNIVLFNASGKRIYQSTYQQAPGSTVKQINMKQMASGIYFLSIFADDKKIITEKILKR